MQFLECLKGRYHEDSFFKQIVQEPSQFQNFHIKNGLIFCWESEKYILYIPRILKNNRNTKEIVIKHAHSIRAHLGPWKTLTYLREQVWWKDMIADINSYCDSCHTCKISKLNNQKLFSLLYLLLVLSRLWESISINFVKLFQEFKNCLKPFNIICTIICLLTS